MPWETRLSTLMEGLTLLQAIQRRWLYLEPIFGRGALPAVAGRFRMVDGEFKAVMAQLQVRFGVAVFDQLHRFSYKLSGLQSSLLYPIATVPIRHVTQFAATYLCRRLDPAGADRVALAQANGKVVSFASLPRVLERLSSMSTQLESCQRALNEFLEDKRAAFPR
jgi:hypothetical protein